MEKRMKMRKTYICGGGWTRLWTTRDKGGVGRKGSSETREARGRTDHLLKNAITTMLPSVPRQDNRVLVDLLSHGVVIHLRVQPLERPAVVIQVLLGLPVVPEGDGYPSPNVKNMN